MDKEHSPRYIGEKEVKEVAQIEIFKVNTLVMQLDYTHKEIDERQLKVGKGYFTHMRFNLSKINYLNKVTKAQLILFKIPMEQSRNHRMDWKYKIVPLLDYVNVCSGYYARPKVDEKWATFFKDNQNIGNIEVDLTDIVNEWLAGDMENKGILIAGRRGSNLLQFAGPKDEMKSMRPFLRITYETRAEDIPPIHPTMIELPTQVTIIKA